MKDILLILNPNEQKKTELIQIIYINDRGCVCVFKDTNIFLLFLFSFFVDIYISNFSFFFCVTHLKIQSWIY